MNELTVVAGDRHLVVEPGRVLEIGRALTSDVVIDDPRVSRAHLRVSFGPQGWTVESVGRAGTFLGGQPVTQFPVIQPVEVTLAAADGPVVRFEPVPADTGATVLPESAVRPLEPSGAQTPAAVGAPAVVGAMASGAAMPPAGAMPPGTGGAVGMPPGVVPAGGLPRPGSAAPTLGQVTDALRMLIPVRVWLHDRALRQWLRVLVALYALAPLVLLIVFRHAETVQGLFQSRINLEDMGWAYSLYVAPLWAIVFWYLIRPGRLVAVDVVIGGLVIGAELILIPAMTIPWENGVPMGPHSGLFRWIYGVGLAEELTKALPIAVFALALLYFRHTKLDVRKWMFLGTISGLMFGVYEASTNYVPGAFSNAAQTVAHAIVQYTQTPKATYTGVATAVTNNAALGVPQFAERVFVDGLQHAIWVGIAAFFIGLGTNYARQRIPLWILGLAIPSVLHGLNDWITTRFTSQWPWIGVQAFSLFLFLGYTASARAIERNVRHTPLFRGESMLYDTSVQDGSDGAGASPPPA